MRPASLLPLLALSSCFIWNPFREREPRGPEPGENPISLIGIHRHVAFIGGYWSDRTPSIRGHAQVGMLDTPALDLDPAELYLGTTGGCVTDVEPPVLDSFRSFASAPDLFLRTDRDERVLLDHQSDGASWRHDYTSARQFAPGAAIALEPFSLLGEQFAIPDFYELRDELGGITGPLLNTERAPRLAARDVVWTWDDTADFEYLFVTLTYFGSNNRILEVRVCVATLDDEVLDPRANATESWDAATSINVELATLSGQRAIASPDDDALALVHVGFVGAIVPP